MARRRHRQPGICILWDIAIYWDKRVKKNIMEKGQARKPKPPKRTAKGTVFTSLYRDKGYLLQLYQALDPEDSTIWLVILYSYQPHFIVIK